MLQLDLWIFYCDFVKLHCFVDIEEHNPSIREKLATELMEKAGPVKSKKGKRMLDWR